MKPERLLSAYIDVATRIGLVVRWERGNFRGGHCKVNGQEVIILNRHHPVEGNLAAMAACLREFDLGDVYMRPIVRKSLSRVDRDR